MRAEDSAVGDEDILRTKSAEQLSKKRRNNGRELREDERNDQAQARHMFAMRTGQRSRHRLLLRMLSFEVLQCVCKRTRAENAVGCTS